MLDTPPGWDACSAPQPEGGSCIGIRIAPYKQCLFHLPASQRAEAIERMEPGGNVDVRGTTMPAELWQQIVVAMTDPSSSKPRFGQARFDQARFTEVASFHGASFDGDATFVATGFEGHALFTEANFVKPVSFDHARFSAIATFDRARISGDGRFDCARFEFPADFTGALFTGQVTTFENVEFGQRAGFTEARFAGPVSFDGTRFADDAWFSRAQFMGPAGQFRHVQFEKTAAFDQTMFTGTATFDGACCGGDALFNGARFDENAWFRGVQVTGTAGFTMASLPAACLDGMQCGADLRLDGATFRGSRLGPLIVGQTLVLDKTVFTEAVEIEAAATSVSCRDTTFRAAADLRLRYAQVNLDRAANDTVLSLAAAAQPFVARLPDGAKGWLTQAVPETMINRHRPAGAVPRLVSLRGVDASRLALTDIDLSCCRFAEARQLDQIRIDGYCPLSRTPRTGRWRWGWVAGLAWPGVWRWSSRRVLTEEQRWRRTTRKGKAWTPTAGVTATSTDDTAIPVLQPHRLEVVYRELRKAQESRGNEPGAADLYYGEMEMRRHSSATPVSERIVLAAYWAVSGYGLRATRALLALAITITVSALVLQHTGFVTRIQPSYLDSVLYSVRASLSLDVTSTGIPAVLTRWGQVLRIALRVTGPLFLGLAALALRGRVKR